MSTKTSKTSRSSDVVTRIYTKRQQEFIATLEKVLQNIATDKLVRQMLSNKTSGQFITRRLEELFYQIITDDREQFIDRLIEKIQTYENVYSDEYGEMVKILGNRILSISDAQNSSHVQRMRHIHTLIEEIRELQEEVATLRQQVAEKDGIIKSLKCTRRTNLFHDGLTDEFLHMYAEVDITQLGQKVKEMSNDCMVVKSAVVTLKKQLETIITQATKTTRSALNAIKKNNQDVETKLKDEISKNESLQKEFDRQIPLLQMELQTREKEVEVLREASNKKNNEFRELKAKNQQAMSLIDAMKQQHEALQLEHDEIVQAHNEAAQSNDKLTDQVETLQKQLSKITRSQAKLEQQLKEQKQENEEQKQANTDAASHLKNIQSKAKALHKELEQQKTANETLTHDNEEKDKDIEELKAKIATISSQNKELTIQTKDQSNEIIELQEKVTTLETQLDSKKQEIQQAQQKMNQKSMEIDQLKTSGANEVTQLQAELKATKQKIDKAQKQNTEQTETINEQKKQISEIEKKNEDLNKQLQQIKSDNKLQVANLQEDNNKLADELESVRALLDQKAQLIDSLQRSLTEAQQQYNETKWHLDEVNEELAEKNKKVEESKTTIAGLLLNKEVDKDENTRLQNTINKLTDQNGELSHEIKKNKKQTDKLNEQIEQLTQSLEKEHQASLSLNKTIEEINDKLQKAALLNQQYQAQIQALNDKNTDLGALLTDLNANNVGEGHSVIADYQRNDSIIRALNDILNVHDKEALINAVTDLSTRASTLEQLESDLKTDNVPQAVHQLQQELQKVSQLTNAKPNQTIIDAVTELLDAYNDTTGFIVRIITTLSHQVSPEKIQFPLPQAKCDSLITSLKSLMDDSVVDKNNIKTLLDKAKGLGFYGDSCLEAAIFISQQKIELEKKNIDVLKAQLDDARSLLKAEQDQRQKDVEKRNQTISDLKKSIIQLTEKNTTDKTALQKEITDLQQKLSDLNAQLANEVTLRREIGRIGQGATADKRLLKSKLTENEFRFIEFIDEIMKKEQRAREIHNDFKQARQAFDV